MANELNAFHINPFLLAEKKQTKAKNKLIYIILMTNKIKLEINSESSQRCNKT